MKALFRGVSTTYRAAVSHQTEAGQPRDEHSQKDSPGWGQPQEGLMGEHGTHTGWQLERHAKMAEQGTLKTETNY